jgi:DNA-binding transcriptional regulator PaaX
MKSTTRKLLFSLARFHKKEPLLLTMEQCHGLLPDLSSSGLRSLLNLLKKQSYVSQERLSSQTTFRLTDIGLSALSLEMPVFSPLTTTWNGQWSALILQEAPRQDRQFRYLREFLLKKGALTLTRGVYLYPGEFPESVMAECRERYVQAVKVFSIGEWIHGDERLFITEKYALLDIAQSYSGISNEIDRVINTKRAYHDLNHQEKKHLFSLFDRLYQTAVEDRGFVNYYFPQVPRLEDLLSRLQSRLF